jgi:hypothetical protein
MSIDNRYETSWARAILAGLQSQPHIYGGTVPEAVVAKRRARNKQARASRKANRK